MALKGVFIGLGLADWSRLSCRKVLKQFQRAGEAGLNLVAHAGEGVGAESVLSAIENLNAQRIDTNQSVGNDSVVSLAKRYKFF